ncbi:MAG: PadR family transcriptional regulator [Thermoplasmata archaeon]
MKGDKSKERLLKGIISILILDELMDGPKHGYAIEKDISEKLGHKLPPGMIYVMLKTLESKGCIKFEDSIGKTGRNVKIYYITDEGKDLLKNHVEQLEKLKIILDNIIYRVKQKI